MQLAMVAESVRGAARRAVAFISWPCEVADSAGRLVRLPWLIILLLTLITAAGVLLRLQGIDRGPTVELGELYNDEYKILANTFRIFRGEPLLAHYPLGLYRWLQPQFALIAAFELPVLSEFKMALTGAKADFADLQTAARMDPEWYVGWLRYNAVFFGMALVLVVFALTRKVAGYYPAIAAATLAAVMPSLVAYSRMFYYDLPMTTWYWITVGVIAWTAQHRSIFGIYIGATMLAWTVTTKQNAVVLFPLWAVVTCYVLVYGSDKTWIRALFSQHLFFSSLLGLAVVLFNYPALLSRETIETMYWLLANRYYTGDLHGGGGGARFWVVWITSLWPSQAPIGVLVVLVAGLVMLPFLSKERITATVILAGLLLYYAIAGAGSLARLRTMLPMMPALCIGIAGWWLLAQRYLRPRPAIIAALCITALAATSFLGTSLRQTLVVMAPDTADLAADWLADNVPHGSKIAREAKTPRIPDVRPRGRGFLWDVAEARRKRAFDVSYYASLGVHDPQYYRDEGIQYLVGTPEMERRAERAVAAGREMTYYDERAPVLGKGTVYKGIHLSDVLLNYEKIEDEFEVAAKFRSNMPPYVRSTASHGAWRLFRMRPGNWLDIKSYLDRKAWDAWIIWDLWERRGEYVFGRTMTIYRVPDATQRAPDAPSGPSPALTMGEVSQ